MDTKAAKLELVKRILDLDDNKLIQGLLDLISTEKETESLSTQEKDEILLGLRQLDAGRRISLDDFLKKVS
ncbi:hypothetical protein [Algoriphagus sp. NG3]|uniref:hypothetical protein n=1 Tax=unclassified Algoriphagus TaxID=2641541 RepID=UPI002A833B8F|nr:hypothetical protein [Algoriphagus sp. NG3]WPR75645.1 hypothetical protein SLW71_23605 [Algoriphagus sp. NG3]